MTRFAVDLADFLATQWRSGDGPTQAHGAPRLSRPQRSLAALGRPVQALIAVRIRPPSRRVLEAFREWARSLPDTLGVFVTSGNEDFLLHVAVPDNNALYEFVIDKLTERAEIADVRTSIVYEQLRNDRTTPARGRMS
jgi:DNA-binding Lrp family transcriptional regulator